MSDDDNTERGPVSPAAGARDRRAHEARGDKRAGLIHNWSALMR